MPKSKGSEPITANEILVHLKDMYADYNQYVCASEVSPRTGAWERRIDFLVMHCFDSEQLKIQGYEIKVSKSDLKRELDDPDKHACFFDSIDFYWMIAPRYVLDDVNFDVFPPKWGVRAVWRDESGKIASRTVRRPTCLHDEQMYSRKIRKTFVASFCRAISKQSLTKAKLYEQQRVAEEEIRKDVERELSEGARVIPEWRLEDLERCKKIVEGLGLNRFSTELSSESFRTAQAIIRNLGQAESMLFGAKNQINTAMRAIGKLTEYKEKERGNDLQGNAEH